MSNVFNQDLSIEQLKIAKSILKGKTHAQIAYELNCSTSSVAYKINNLFEKLNVKNRAEFTTIVISQIIKNNKEMINSQKELIRKYEKEKKNLKSIIANLLTSKNDNSNYQFWCDKAKILLDSMF